MLSNQLVVIDWVEIGEGWLPGQRWGPGGLAATPGLTAQLEAGW